jgi:hypothetical protein
VWTTVLPNQGGHALMTEKLVNVAIFWLPLFAGILLGGLVPSVWYGGDKLSALWMGFFGVVCLLLTGTFQLQRYISENVLQPSLELSPSADRFILSWDSSFSNLLNIRGENDTGPKSNWRSPTFTIKNSSSISAQDVTFKWTAAKYDPSAVISSAARFKHATTNIVGDSELLISTPNTGGGQNSFAFSASTSAAFITKQADAFIPLNIWNAAAIRFVETTPDQANGKSEPYIFELSISWNIPENTKPERFRITATATNIKTSNSTPPELMAAIDFAVKKID